ncbi:hypothetical protein COR50_18300 [Chitinophaga caeni]|uniref:Uncharacterized protein n=1 Tax=Chitinophaga caeni TaxID=2029983 RepID=A0A291QYM3_9BACT|nr:hypothetical protein [Chitinophaga caeni]ATL48963.1 hypothetical protein COR50_18300 [Chitinophaga caeni]
MPLHNYPGFDYAAADVAKFLRSSDLFTILLHDEEVIHFRPGSPDNFHSWLKRSNIPDMRIELAADTAQE